MKAEKELRFGVVGVGGMGTYRVKTLIKPEFNVKIVAVSDINPAALDNIEKVMGTKDFKHYTGPNDYKKMIDNDNLDAICIFTPHDCHLPMAKYAAQKGVNILIEKPMVCGAANAMEVTRIVNEKKLKAIIHYQRHYELKWMKARELIQKGDIGQVTNFYVFMAQDWRGREWRGIPEKCLGGQINDSGSHYQDIILWMLDELPVSAQGHIDNFYRDHELKVEANGSFHVELTNGITGRFVILSDIPGGFVDDVRICGTKANLYFNGDKLIRHDIKKDEYEEIPMTRPKNYPDSPIDNFIKLMRGKTRTNHVPFIFGCRVALLTDAMLRSGHKNGKKIVCEDLLKEKGYSLNDLRD